MNIVAKAYDDLARLLDEVEDSVIEPEGIKTPPVSNEPEKAVSSGLDIDSLARELGIDLSNVDVNIETPPPMPVEPKKRRERKAKAEKPVKEKPVKPKKEEKKVEPEVTPTRSNNPHPNFRMDAPVPVVKYRDLVIGYYGNILESLAEPDKDGFTWKERKLGKYQWGLQERYRDTNGRMVLVINEKAGRYIVGVGKPDGSFEGILEVTNRGRGVARCKQLAQALELAYLERSDEIRVEDAQYQEYKAKTPEAKLNFAD